jgi:hypothetical protein
MNDIAQRPGPGADDDPAVDGPDGRLTAYIARTRTALDLLALATLWIVIVHPGDFGTAHNVRAVAWTVRAAVSLVYGIDITIRSVLARRHLHYLLTHPLAIVSVIFPPVPYPRHLPAPEQAGHHAVRGYDWTRAQLLGGCKQGRVSLPRAGVIAAAAGGGVRDCYGGFR